EVLRHDLSCAGAWSSVSVFFFQAEDGIRDGHVTGVQTCALPISRRPSGRAAEVARRLVLTVDGRRVALAPVGRGLIAHPAGQGEIGRASCRERGERWGGGVR